MESVKTVEKDKQFCYDCKKEIKINGQEIENGVLLTYKDNEEKITVLKCNQCYESNPSLKNYKKCEVYSRIVGYLRPVSQWNEGKKLEFEERKVYQEPKII